MPTVLSCKSASALDSLPRNANARRSGTALHRLQQQHRSSSSSSSGAQGHDEFAAATGDASSSSTPLLPRRKLSNKMTGGGGVRPRRRSSGKAKLSNGLSSNDLPLASSDLYAATADRGAFSDGEQDRLRGVSEDSDDDDAKSIRVVGAPSKGKPRVRALSFSPSKQYQPIMSAALPQSSPDVSPHRAAAALPLVSQLQSPPSPTKQASSRRQRAAPSRKRVVTKDMIGLPTNFQHTGHIGTASYGALPRTGYDAEQLRLQLSEVAAALRLDDCPTVAEAVPVANVMLTAPPAIVPAAEAQLDTPASHVSGLKRTTSKRKPVPAPRKLADLYGEFSSQVDEEASLANDENAVRPTPVPSSIAEEETQAEVQGIPRPIPTTLRANGKRMVQGPAGEYITDTANVRWNKALNEITLALKDDDDDDDEEDIQQGLARADSVLKRLNAM